jgi:hypothetical protein
MNLNEYFKLVESELIYGADSILVNDTIRHIVESCLTEKYLILEEWDAEDINLGISLYMAYGMLFWNKQRYLHMAGDGDSRDKFYYNFILLIRSIPDKYKTFQELHPWYIKLNSSMVAHDCPRNHSNPHVEGYNTSTILNRTTTRKNPVAVRKLYNKINTTQWVISHNNEPYELDFLEAVDLDGFTTINGKQALREK